MSEMLLLPEKTASSEEKQISRPWLFQKGQSGNPLGKKKGARHFTTLVREALIKIAKDPTTGKSEKLEVLLAKKAVLSALAGDTNMLKTIWNYLDGMPSQNINVSNNDELRKEYFDKLDELNKRNSKDNL